MDERQVIATGPPERLDRWLRRTLPGLSRRLAHALIADGSVRIDGHRASKGSVVRPGACLRLPATLALAPNPALDLPIMYEDAWLVVVDKPGGLPSHALDPRECRTVANFVLARYPETAPLGGGLVHRLDTGTSGLVVAARSPAAWTALREAFHQQSVEKEYLAIVAGHAPAERTVDLPLSHDPRDRRRMIAARAGLRSWPAVSVVRRLAAGDTVSLVAVVMRTGVTHQIRAHLAALGHPVVGDALYDGPLAALPPGRHALHATRLSLPSSGDRGPLTIRCPLALDLQLLTPSRSA